MATVQTTRLQQALQLLVRHQGMLVPVGLVASIMVLVIPLSPPFMDLLLSFNIALSVLILLTTIYVTTPIQFFTAIVAPAI